MDLRVLRYFLAVAREKSIVKASEVLHITQPTLSRQLKELEDEFGATLFYRGSKTHGISLTEKGMLLRQRAEELVELADRTQLEMKSNNDVIGGDITIGSGESDGMRIIAKTANRLKDQYPDIHYHLYSGNAEDVKERLDKGLLDFGIFVGAVDLQKYNSLPLPSTDHWGLLVRNDSPLAGRKSLSPEELLHIPLIVSRQQDVSKNFEEWTGFKKQDLNITATYNLLYNAALMVEEGFGSALCIDNIVKTEGSANGSFFGCMTTESTTGLSFIPVMPVVTVPLHIAWKKYQLPGKAQEVFLEELKRLCQSL